MKKPSIRSWEIKIIELRKMPPMKDRQKYRRILEEVITSF